MQASVVQWTKAWRACTQLDPLRTTPLLGEVGAAAAEGAVGAVAVAVGVQGWETKRVEALRDRAQGGMAGCVACITKRYRYNTV